MSDEDRLLRERGNSIADSPRKAWLDAPLAMGGTRADVLRDEYMAVGEVLCEMILVAVSTGSEADAGEKEADGE